MVTAYILFGANLGDRVSTFEKAERLIEERVGRISSRSSDYVSDPVGFVSKDRFLNRTVAVETGLSPIALLDALQGIEKELGRVRLSDKPQYDESGNRIYTSRTIDLDILLYGDSVIEEERLSVPHPRMFDRAFTMIPLSEQAYDLEIRCPDGSAVIAGPYTDKHFSEEEKSEVKVLK